MLSVNTLQARTIVNSMKNKKWLIVLHLLMLVYSFGNVCSKLAGNAAFGSFTFLLMYGFVIATLGIYALGWQQVIRRMPLTTAFANKAVTVVWGLFWGVLWFREQITAGKIIGAVLVMIGVVIFANADGEIENVE